MIRNCAVCGNTFDGRGYALCCCKACRDEFKMNYSKYHILCKTCGNPLTYEQARKGHVFCSFSCSHRHPDALKKASDNLKSMWDGTHKSQRNSDNRSFRDISVDRMKNNNPSKNKDVVANGIKTKEQNGTLHVWCGERGGNGTISDGESAIMDFCISNGFLYNFAIKTGDLRKRYPDKRYSVNYKPDFVNLELKLCIEIDGKTHRTKLGKARDRKKEECLSMLGYTVLRFTNEQVLSDLESCVVDVKCEMERLSDGKVNIT